MPSSNGLTRCSAKWSCNIHPTVLYWSVSAQPDRRREHRHSETDVALPSRTSLTASVKRRPWARPCTFSVGLAVVGLISFCLCCCRILILARNARACHSCSRWSMFTLSWRYHDQRLPSLSRCYGTGRQGTGETLFFKSIQRRGWGPGTSLA